MLQEWGRGAQEEWYPVTCLPVCGSCHMRVRIPSQAWYVANMSVLSARYESPKISNWQMTSSREASVWQMWVQRDPEKKDLPVSKYEEMMSIQGCGTKCRTSLGMSKPIQQLQGDSLLTKPHRRLKGATLPHPTEQPSAPNSRYRGLRASSPCLNWECSWRPTFVRSAGI